MDCNITYHEEGYLSCDDSCSFNDGDFCGCTSAIKNVSSPDDVNTALSSEDRFNYLLDFYSMIYKSMIGGSRVLKEYTYSRSGIDYTGYVPIYTKGDRSGDAVSWAELGLLNSLLLKTQLFPGTTGLMPSGAASNDPLFWVMHQVFDKAVHVLRLSPKYNKHASWLQWDNCAGYMNWKGTTPFTAVDFEPYLGSHYPEDSDAYLRTDMIWALLKPDGKSIPYVYDQLTTWGD